MCHTKIGTQRNYRSGKKGNAKTFSNAAAPDRGKRVNALKNEEADEFFIGTLNSQNTKQTQEE